MKIYQNAVEILPPYKISNYLASRLSLGQIGNGALTSFPSTQQTFVEVLFIVTQVEQLNMNLPAREPIGDHGLVGKNSLVIEVHMEYNNNWWFKSVVFIVVLGSVYSYTVPLWVKGYWKVQVV